MIEFNLLPRDSRGVRRKKSALKLKIPQIPPTPIIIGAISFTLFIQAIVGVLAFMKNKRYAALSIAYGQIASQEQVAKTLQKEADELSKRFQVIDSLTAGSLLWSKKLYDLKNSIPEGIWLSSMYLKEELPQAASGAAVQRGGNRPAPKQDKMQTLILRGSAVSANKGEEAAIVGKFIELLKNDKDIGDVILTSIERKKLGPMEVMDFTVVCHFQPGRRYFEKLEAGTI